MEQLSGRSVTFVEGDIRDSQTLEELFSWHAIQAVIHFATVKAVGESTQIPLAYYQNNVHGSLCLLEMMQVHDVNDFIFSSSATVYGEKNSPPYVETMPLGLPASAYGTSKVMVEMIMADQVKANVDFRGVSLRYFNPIGAHDSGRIGEDPNGIPNNLLFFVGQISVGKLEQLSIFGDDYATADGTCERDYLHVMDLAEGHVAALEWIQKEPQFRGVENFNLGTGNSVSVLQIVKAFEQACGKPIPCQFAPLREGDLAAFWADARKADELLSWQVKRPIEQIMEDTWRWQSANPDGYAV